MDELKEIIENLNDKVYYDKGRFSQFTIDLIENLYESANDENRDFNKSEGSGSLIDFVGAICYQIGTIIEVLKEGEDKRFFVDTLTAFELLKNKL